MHSFSYASSQDVNLDVIISISADMHLAALCSLYSQNEP